MNKKADKILNTTVSLFIRDGVKKITMDDIAQNAKSSKVTVYKYFVDKDTLYLEVGRYIFLGYTKRLEDLIASGETLVKKLCGFLDIISDFTDSGEFSLCEELAAYNLSVEAEYAWYLEAYRRTMRTLIEEGINDGLLKRELDRDIIFHYIDMGVNYYQQNALYREKMHEGSGFQKQFMAFYISNLFRDGTRIRSAT